VIYLDTSAALKAIIDEPETAAVRRLFADGTSFVASRLLDVELHAVSDRRGIDRARVADLVAHVALVSLDDETADAAIALHSGLRTLDALHLATAFALSDTVTEVLTFDRELADAFRAQGFALHAACAQVS